MKKIINVCLTFGFLFIGVEARDSNYPSTFPDKVLVRDNIQRCLGKISEYLGSNTQYVSLEGRIYGTVSAFDFFEPNIKNPRVHCGSKLVEGSYEIKYVGLWRKTFFGDIAYADDVLSPGPELFFLVDGRFEGSKLADISIILTSKAKEMRRLTERAKKYKGQVELD